MIREQLQRHSIPRHGFTLVELMVAMVLMGMLTSIIYGLFSTTADSMSEADSLADTVNKARFAIEQVRTDIQAAGSQGSPDASEDMWVQPKGVPMFGILSYPGWQDNQLGSATDNPGALADGIILIGAYDTPQSFLIDNVQEGAGSTAFEISNNSRGVHKLVVTNPFSVDPVEPFAGYDITAFAATIANRFDGRVLRVSDRQGYMQFAAVNAAAVSGNVVEGTTSQPLQFKGPGKIYGIDAAGEEDVGYEAALLDAYWYYVRPSPSDPTNFQLVRERLNLADMVGGSLLGLDPNGFATGERVVVTDRVVNFQIWFDCDQGDGTLSSDNAGAEWNTAWNPPAGGTCIASDPRRARIAHIRLSLRTEMERKDRPHYNMPPLARGFETADGPLRTFAVNPDAVGSASVVTVQTSVELANFAMRGN